MSAKNKPKIMSDEQIHALRYHYRDGHDYPGEFTDLDASIDTELDLLERESEQENRGALSKRGDTGRGSLPELTGHSGEAFSPTGPPAQNKTTILSPRNARGEKVKTIKSPVSFVPDVKEALSTAAKERGVSASLIIDEALRNHPDVDKQLRLGAASRANAKPRQ